MVNRMAYDIEKYRDKREKVLGMKRRGIGFGTFALLISAGILVGLSLVVIPKSVAYLRDRGLDDAIYRIGKNQSWPQQSIDRLRDQPGVKMVMMESFQISIRLVSMRLSRLWMVICRHHL